MKLNIFQIDAFANSSFEGNPAAVIPLEEWLPDELMQTIAAENNLSETAYFVQNGTGYHIRWFTPVQEVELCGHATLASSFVIFNIFGHGKNEILFESMSGELRVKRNQDWFEMNFPADPPVKCETPKEILGAFIEVPVVCLKSQDYIVVFANEHQVLGASPNYALLSKLDLRGVIITSESKEYDFVSRCFAPKYGINEDPVTGSAFTQLMPYWSKKMNKNKLFAKQVSKRGGEVRCVDLGERILISGKAVKYMEGTIEI